jgi:hypothetical protein
MMFIFGGSRFVCGVEVVAAEDELRVPVWGAAERQQRAPNGDTKFISVCMRSAAGQPK